MPINLLSHFPTGYEPRPQQLEILNKIQLAIEDGKKFIIVQAPTGSGKSHVAATLAQYSRSCPSFYKALADRYELHATSGIEKTYIHEEAILNSQTFGAAVLTVSKQLQNQYASVFSDARVLKGRQNYVCAVDDSFDCDLAPCSYGGGGGLQQKCMDSNSCPSLNARRIALSSKFAVFNYSMFLSTPPFLRRRQFFICDEASELEDEFVKGFSCEIEYSRLSMVGVEVGTLLSTDNTRVYQWLTDACITLTAAATMYAEQIAKNAKHKRQLVSAISKFKYCRNMVERLSIVMNMWTRAEYITEITKTGVTLTPLYVDIMAREFFDMCDHAILMSGTIIDHETYAATLGIKSHEYAYIDVPSSFDPAKSPIYCASKFKLNYNNMDKVLPSLAKAAIGICDSHKDLKGIIHTHTFKITGALVNEIKGDPRYLVRNMGKTNEHLLDQHFTRTDSTVLISPSLGFGADLKDDFGRFSIIMKAPYLPLGSERIKRLAEKSRRWYEMKAIVNIMQMCGRTTRSEDDYSYTYILDGSAVDLIKRNAARIPEWFLKRFY